MNIRYNLSGLCIKVLFMLIINTIAFASTIYVNNISGLDSKTGQNSNISDSVNGPVGTINRAVQLASNGDSISIAYTAVPYTESGPSAGIALLNKSVFLLPTGIGSNQLIIDKVTINVDSRQSVIFSGAFKIQSTLNLQSGILTVLGNLALSDSASISGNGTLTFAGTGAQLLAVPSTGVTIPNFTINMTGTNPRLTITGGNITISSLSLTNGLIILPGTNNIILGSYTKNSSNLSHIVGNVQRSIPINSTGRFEFPVGTLTAYRLAAITFNSPIIISTTITISADSTFPNSNNGFPITVNGVTIDSAAKFCWSAKANPSLGPSQVFDLEFTGSGFVNYTSASVQNIRVVSKLGIVILSSGWLGQIGTYSNYESVPGVPVVSINGTSGGLITLGSIFTFGFKKACGTCGGFNFISGKVFYGNSNSNGVKNAVVTLNPGRLTSTTNAVGAFRFNVVDSGSYTSYTLSAVTFNTWLGANATDALLVSAYFNGITSFSAIQKLAGDVNASGSINNTDALLIVRRFAGLDGSFAAGNWVFTIPSMVIGGSDVTANINALSTGDVNGSDSTSLSSIPKNIQTVSLVRDGIIKTPVNHSINIPVKIGSDMQLGAVSLRFKYPADIAKFEGLTESKFIASDNHGTISIAWADMTGGREPLILRAEDKLVALNFRPTGNFKTGTSFSVALDVNNSEFAAVNGSVINSAVIKAPSIEASIPAEFSLRQNYPNPFNPSTKIEYDLPYSARIKLVVYNIIGEQVATLVNQVQNAGSYSIDWNAGNKASGIYFYRATVDAGNKQFTQIRRMMLLK